uniref:Uncharacterized protein n=1 Tax=Amphimedon queenslandica TaxID=400682 RepID=A0A1X7U2T3_AMPQE
MILTCCTLHIHVYISGCACLIFYRKLLFLL